METLVVIEHAGIVKLSPGAYGVSMGVLDGLILLNFVDSLIYEQISPYYWRNSLN